MKVQIKKIFIGAVGASLILSGCATTGGQKTAVDRALSKCVLSVGGGALLGGIIGNNVGDGNAAKGAVIGGLAGAGVCGFILNRASKEDKERIRQLELAALESQTTGKTVETFMATNGVDSVTVATTTSDVESSELPEKVASRMVNNDVQAASDADAGEARYTNCRYVQTDISVSTNTVSGAKELTCRTETGDWESFSV